MCFALTKLSRHWCMDLNRRPSTPQKWQEHLTTVLHNHYFSIPYNLKRGKPKAFSNPVCMPWYFILKCSLYKICLNSFVFTTTVLVVLELQYYFEEFGSRHFGNGIINKNERVLKFYEPITIYV